MSRTQAAGERQRPGVIDKSLFASFSSEKEDVTCLV
jgi:hypothetical protein